MNVSSFLKPDAQPPKLIEPSERPLHDPAPLAQSASMFSVTLGEPRHDAAGTQPVPYRLGVITAVA